MFSKYQFGYYILSRKRSVIKQVIEEDLTQYISFFNWENKENNYVCFWEELCRF